MDPKLIDRAYSVTCATIPNNRCHKVYRQSKGARQVNLIESTSDGGRQLVGVWNKGRDRRKATRNNDRTLTRIRPCYFFVPEFCGQMKCSGALSETNEHQAATIFSFRVGSKSLSKKYFVHFIKAHISIKRRGKATW
jgi:hypothetical protein